MYNDDSSKNCFHYIKKDFCDSEDSPENIYENQNEVILFKPNCYFENSKDKNVTNNAVKEILTKTTNYDEKTDNRQNYFEIHFSDNENSVYILPKDTMNNKNSTKEEKTIMKKQLGNKSGRTLGSGKYIHDKYSDDNLRRISKHLVLKTTQDFINSKIIEKYRGKIGRGIFILKLLTLNQKQKSDCSIEFNKLFLNKTLGDIFSDNISSRYTIFLPNHNKKVVDYLKNENNPEISDYFKKIFDLSFLDCLKYFRGSDNNINQLQGMTRYDVIKNKYKDDEDYIKSLDYYIMNFEIIINNKRSRKSKKKSL